MVSDTEERALGRLEGRMEEQGALLHQLHSDLTTDCNSSALT